MLIVSQNRKEVVNINNTTRIFIEDLTEESGDFGIGADTNSAESQVWDLGYYQTEERAKQVLEELVYYKAIFEYYRYSPKSVQDDIAEDFIKDEVMFDTYEMPEE